MQDHKVSRLRSSITVAVAMFAVAAVAPVAASAAVTPTVSTPTIAGGSTPAANSTVGPNPSFSFSTSTGSVTYRCQMDSGNVYSCTSPYAYTGLTDGAHTFKVYAMRTSYNNSSTAQLAFTVDATAPGAPTLSGAPATNTKETSASISFTAAEAGGTMTCSVDGGTYSACTSPVALTGLADGLHSLAVKQTDAVGNTGAAATKTWTVDTTAPGSVSGWTGLVDTVVTNDALSHDWALRRIFFTLPEPVGGLAQSHPVECRIDSGSWGDCWSVSGTGGYHYVPADLSGGSHTLSIRITDLVGNVSAVSTSPSWTVDDGTLKVRDTGLGMTVDGCKSVCPDSVVIPDKWGTKYVTEITTQAFLNTGITSITLPSTLKTIWTRAFEGTKLTSITLPPYLQTIADDAFKGTAITSLTIPSSVGSIGAGAFSNMKDLTSVSMPNGITAIPMSLFAGSSSLTSFSIPYTVRSIGAYAFSETGLSSITLPLSFDGTIADGAFMDMPNLTTVSWFPYPGSAITSIGWGAFDGSQSLTSIPKLVGGSGGLKSVGDNAFYNTAISSLTIPDSVTSIGAAAFGEMSQLTSITLPSGLTTIPDYVLSGTSKLTGVTIPSGVTSIGNGAFQGSGITGVTLPSGLTEIRTGTFRESSIKSITIPNGVTSIGQQAFQNATALESVGLPSTLKTVGESAFDGASSITSLTLPSGVKSVGWYAFRSMTSLTSVTLPTALEDISTGAFMNTPSLESLTIPANIKSIGDFAFAGAGTKSPQFGVRFEGNAPTMGEDPFYLVKSGTKATLASPTLTGYGYNGDLFHGLTVTGGLDPADTTPPTTPGSFTGVPSSPTNAAGSTIGFTLGESGGTVECRVDSGSWGACGSVSGTTGSYTVASLADGSHTVSVRQTDAAGNVSQVGTSSSWTVDTTAPAAPSLSGAPSGSTTSTSESISFTGEAGGAFECSVDGGAYASCGSPKSLSGLSAGSHSLAVRQIDAAGNTGSVATASWTVTAPASDTTAPTTPGSFTGVPSSPTTATSATIGFTLGEAGGTVQCRLDAADWGSCSSVSGTSGSHTVSGLAPGSHTVSVRQTDAAGNVSKIGTSASWTVASVVAPTILTPAAGVKTVYKSGDKWAIKVGLLVSTGGDARSSAQLLTVQVAVDSAGRPVATKPSDTLAPPTTASFANGVVAWDASGEVLRQSLDRPTWVRVGNRSGKWTAWVKLTP